MEMPTVCEIMLHANRLQYWLHFMSTSLQRFGLTWNGYEKLFTNGTSSFLLTLKRFAAFWNWCHGSFCYVKYFIEVWASVVKGAIKITKKQHKFTNSSQPLWNEKPFLQGDHVKPFGHCRHYWQIFAKRSLEQHPPMLRSCKGVDFTIFITNRAHFQHSQWMKICLH